MQISKMSLARFRNLSNILCSIATFFYLSLVLFSLICNLITVLKYLHFITKSSHANLLTLNFTIHVGFDILGLFHAFILTFRRVHTSIVTYHIRLRTASITGLIVFFKPINYVFHADLIRSYGKLQLKMYFQT